MTMNICKKTIIFRFLRFLLQPIGWGYCGPRAPARVTSVVEDTGLWSR